MEYYRITGPYDYSKPHELDLDNDDAAFEYANSLVDGPEMATVEKLINGKWHYWYIEQECWMLPEDIRAAEGIDESYDGGGWPGDGSGTDDLADYNQMEADDYRYE